MPRYAYAAAAGLVLIAVIVAAIMMWPKGFEPMTLDESFEAGLTDWIIGADLPEDPNNPGNPVAYSITQSSLRRHAGEHSAEFSIDGLQDDGTIWLMRSVQVPGGASKIDLEFQLYSDTESFNTIAVVVGYVGPDKPILEEDMVDLGPANQAAGWKLYSHSVDAEQGETWIAFGVSVRWETQMTYWVDSVKIAVR